MAGGVNIKVKFDVDKAVKDSIGDLKKGLEGVSKSIDSVINKIETGLGGIGGSLSQNLGDLFNVDNMKGLKQVEQAMNVLKDAYKNNKIAIEQYLPLMDKLNAKYNELAASATKASASTNIKGNLPTDAINAAKEGGMVNFVDKMDIADLQQIIALSKQELGLVSTTGEKRERLGKQLDASKAALKNLTLSDKQRAELAERDLKAQERKTAQLEKQAIAQRRANGDKQYEFAMGMEAKTLEQMIAKTKELEFARKKLDSTTKEGQDNITNVNREMERLKIQQDAVLKSGLNLADANGRTSRSFRELAQIAGAYFSVYAVRNFMTEVANVTGEFDLQRKALQALLQDRIAADAIFEKIKAQAIQSPFSVMQLTSATKQLAAYRIEADNLFDTTMMLSDVSAGLGVDMERLILAFGQVKAASVLRGQEVRQFTEAGIPLISLLADKFGELEGRVVSTGEVFDKISNRLVPFEMINDIFKDMTASGGMFYEMQKLQAETIKGRLVNLTDAYQLFLDKMGTANSGIIKGFIGGLEAILRNMDSILPILKGLIAGFITYKTVVFALNAATLIKTNLTKLNTAAKIANLVITKQLTRAEVEATAATNGLNSKLLISLAKNPYAALAAAAIGLATAIGLAVYNAGKFNREIEKIETTGIQDYNRLTNTFKNLVGVMRDTTKSLEEQNDAYEELKRTFKDILPQKYLEEQYLRSTALAYDEVTAAIYNNIKAKVNEQKLIALEENVGAKVAETEKQAVKKLMQNTNISEGQALGYIVKLKEAIDKDKLNFEQAKEYTLKLFNITTEEYYKYYASLSPFLENYTRFSRNFREITQDTFAEAETSFIEFGERLGRLRDVTTSETKKFIDLMKKSTSSDNFIVWFNRVNEQFKSSLRQIMAEPASAQRNVLYEQVEQERKRFLADYNETAKIVIRIGELSKQFGLSSNTLMSSLRKQGEGRSDWSSRVLEDIETREKQVEMYNIASEANKKSIIQDIDSYTKEIAALKQFAKEQGFVEKSNKSASDSKDPLLNAIKEEISLIEELNKKYKELFEASKSRDDARSKTANIYADRIKSLQEKLKKFGVEVDFGSLINLDQTSITKAYNDLLTKFKDNPKLISSIQEGFTPFGVDIELRNLGDIELQLKNEFERIKNNRAISLEINDAPEQTRDVLKLLYGIDEKDILSDIAVFQDKVNKYLSNGLIKIGADNKGITDFTKITRDQFLEILEPFKEGDEYNKIAKLLIAAFDNLKDEQKKYIDNIGKSYQELLNKYAEFNTRIVEVESKKNQELKTLDATYYTDALKKTKTYIKLRQAILNRAAKETAAIKYEELKQSEEYLNLFDRIEILGEGNMVESYIKVRQGIVDAFASGTISLKQFKSQLAELDKQFQEFYMQTGNFVAYLQGGLDGLFKNMSETSYNIQAIATKIEKIGSSGDPVKFFSNISQDEINYLEEKGKDINEIAQNANFDTKAVANNLETSAKEMSTVAAKGAAAAMWVQLIVQNIYGAIKGINELRAAFDRLNESQGDFVNQYTTDNDKFWTTLGNFNETAMQGFEQLKSGNVLGALATTIKSYVDIFSDFNELADKQIQEKIDDTTKSIERQEDAINRLQKAVDKQLGSDWLAGMNKIAEGYAQIAEDIQAKIVAEKGKKNPDDDVLYQYEQDLLDAEDNYKETVERMVEELTGADLKSAAEDFASIWLDAFLQGEDAMAAIEDRFDQMIKNMVVKAIASKIVAGILQKTFDAVEAAVDDGDVTQAEIDRINAEGEYAMTLINEKLGALGGWFRDLLGTGGTAETLQKGIQGITEQTAGIIEGYLNTIRYEIFRHTGILQSIQTQMQLNNNINSDILYQATLSYQVLVAIRDWQNSITTTDNGLPAIRVV